MYASFNSNVTSHAKGYCVFIVKEAFVSYFIINTKDVKHTFVIV